MTIGPEGHRQRLRERFAKSGLDGFHDHEVLELLLTFVILRRDVKPLAKELLDKLGSLAEIFDAPPVRLQQIDGIGPQAATFIAVIPRLLERYQRDRWNQERQEESPLHGRRGTFVAIGNRDGAQ